MSDETVPEPLAEALPTSTEEQEEMIETVEPPLEPACEQMFKLLSLQNQRIFLGMDLSDYKPKVDHFEQLHALGQENVVVGAHNFRQVNCRMLSN